MTTEHEPTLVPFADDETAMTIGDFNVENGTQRLALFGSIDITRDAAGLRKARALRDLLDAAIRQIEASPAVVQPAAPSPSVRTTDNPFEDPS